LWKAGHRPPALCIEVVSAGHPSKDYEDIPARCAAAGVAELWVLDPKLAGPRAPSGPHRVQVFSRQEDGALLRVHAGDGAGWSPLLRAYVVPREGAFVIAADAEGEEAWLTGEQAAGAAARVEAAARRAALEVRRAALEEKRAALAEEQRALVEKERALEMAAAERRAREEERGAQEEALARVAELDEELRRRRRHTGRPSVLAMCAARAPFGGFERATRIPPLLGAAIQCPTAACRGAGGSYGASQGDVADSESLVHAGRQARDLACGRRRRPRGLAALPCVVVPRRARLAALPAGRPRPARHRGRGRRRLRSDRGGSGATT
ncbi:MAG: Uma2 family endonuclease, partial [Polyangiaceae bacterium]|nr:Uma2 family endonuclease [Polyangiaceae bacterium]